MTPKFCPLPIPAEGGAALYLVSDGVGAVTPPHRHETWAVIAGLEGREMNQIYTSVSSDTKDVEQIDAKFIGPGDSIIMSDEDIHGTVSVGATATFHLHLYGTDLSLLAPFSDRIYNAVPVRRQS
jgi:predicted metal-dependent enzyme (double-stranded beta helix superfamily)